MQTSLRGEAEAIQAVSGKLPIILDYRVAPDKSGAPRNDGWRLMLAA